MTLSLYAMADSFLVGGPLNRLQIDALFVHLVKRGHFAQSLDAVDHELADVIDLFVRVEAADAEPDRRVRELFAHAHRPKNVARLEARARAGRTARHRDVFDGHHHRLALDERERDVEVARQAVLERTVQLYFLERREQVLAEPL